MTDAPKTPLEVVQAFMLAMETKDYEAGLRLIADDCDYTNFPGTSVRGPKGILAVLEPFFAPIERNEFVILRQAAQGNVVFMERLDRHRLPDRWVELPVNGTYEVVDGKITVWHDYFDMTTLLTAWPELATQV